MKRWFGFAIWLATFTLLLGACGSDDEKDQGKNVCEQACDKIEECPGQQCTLQFDTCTGSEKALADCVLATPCDQLTSCI